MFTIIDNKTAAVQATHKLFNSFLKKHKLFGRYFYNYFFYRNDMSLELTSFSTNEFIPGRLALYFLLNAKDFKYYYANKYSISDEDLVLSQLWRFYLLENLDMFPISLRASIKANLRKTILGNGTRRNEEIINLMKKYDLC